MKRNYRYRVGFFLSSEELLSHAEERYIEVIAENKEHAHILFTEEKKRLYPNVGKVILHSLKRSKL